MRLVYNRDECEILKVKNIEKGDTDAQGHTSESNVFFFFLVLSSVSLFAPVCCLCIALFNILHYVPFHFPLGYICILDFLLNGLVDKLLLCVFISEFKISHI